MTDEMDATDERHAAAVMGAVFRLAVERPEDPMMVRIATAVGIIREELRRAPGEGDVATAYAVLSVLFDPTPAMLAAPGADITVWRAMISAALDDRPI